MIPDRTIIERQILNRENSPVECIDFVDIHISRLVELIKQFREWGSFVDNGIKICKYIHISDQGKEWIYSF